MKKLWAALHGVFWCVLFSFPSGALLMSVWRFPIPFAGYRSGIRHVGDAFFAVGFYGILGGFVLLGVLGAVAGLITHGLHPEDEREQKRLTRIITALLALAVLPHQ